MYIDFLNVKVRLTCHKLRVEKFLHRLQTFYAFSQLDVLLTPALVSLLILLNSSDGSASVRMVLDKTIPVVACTDGIDKLLNITLCKFYVFLSKLSSDSNSWSGTGWSIFGDPTLWRLGSGDSR